MPRFERRAETLQAVVVYLGRRAVQGLRDGWRWDGRVWGLTEGGEVWGGRTEVTRGEEVYQSVYVLDHCTGRGRFGRALARWPQPILTAPDCALEGYLKAKGIAHAVARGLTDTPEYQAIARAFDDRYAARSGVHYMNHIDEGLAVLAAEGASDAAQRAFCLHPLLQQDADLAIYGPQISDLTASPDVALLATEYRHVANASLSHHPRARPEDIPLSPLPAVNAMLRADKIQNYKDFLLYHADTHPRRADLVAYFQRWLDRLNVTAAAFEGWRVTLDVERRAHVAGYVEV